MHSYCRNSLEGAHANSPSSVDEGVHCDHPHAGSVVMKFSKVRALAHYQYKLKVRKRSSFAKWCHSHVPSGVPPGGVKRLVAPRLPLRVPAVACTGVGWTLGRSRHRGRRGADAGDSLLQTAVGIRCRTSLTRLLKPPPWALGTGACAASSWNLAFHGPVTARGLLVCVIVCVCVHVCVCMCVCNCVCVYTL